MSGSPDNSDHIMKNIILVGFMGTGKTTVAKALARDLKMTYVSIDELIKKREKKAINNIFRDEGESYFRKIEKEVVKEVMQKTGQVVDAGGGACLDHENMENMKKSGLVVCLWTDPTVIYERTKKCGHRPLLNVDDPGKRIQELLDHRRSFYEQADFHVDTTEFDINVITEGIKRIANEEKKSN